MDERETKIQEGLEQIRPFLQRDGGDIEYVGLTEDGVVQVRLQGHCAGCPGARMTMEGVVARVLMEGDPDIKGVEAVD
ncbi:MAG: NifU family protein [Eubacteriaceae bacterium]|nr:NifU family protein [Eubacteriaceae bacterium]